ncbi:MAG: succinate dehydrogenase, hydrophobic membrane anchor protein [Sneathiella sp.]|uniref:succinate dehydrogenase, hydrophobic membrane anchor protein n=1 Tax=Sneathiella sp. TaxID=1964365 RepID=UPI000C41B124|nr:succinate dehydrogenase, hydrophobic membrane anchor protein [Sneathiella sp.]MAL78961.1 succinate dehydrogenase, hydrophobic membrane anchor protein [Sneathiella sp.]|tara:strand:- start:147 stop:527 length:381 start_codon:yes stop_codon:yes gene_type:complete
MGMRAPLKNVRGLGSAKEGTTHWWHQKVTAVAMIPLFVIGLAYVICLVGADYATVYNTLSRPFASLVLLLMIAATFYHLKLGLQVVIEDYIHTESTKFILLLLNSFVCAVVGLAAALAVLKLALGG